MVCFDLDEIRNDDEECQAMLQRVVNLKGEFDDLVSRKVAAQIDALEKERQRLIGELQEEEGLNPELANEQAELTNAWGQIDDAVRITFRDLSVFERDEAPDPKFALPADFAKFNKQVEEMESAVADAKYKQTAYNRLVGIWRERQTKHNQRLHELNEGINRVWNMLERLKGKKVKAFDRTTGLPV